MKKRKIIIVTTALTNDGAERILTQLSNEWIRLGHQVKILLIGKPTESSGYAVSDKIEIVNIYQPKKSRIGWYFKQIRALIRMLNKDKDATVISFLSQSIYILALCKPFIRNQIVFSERNDPNRWPEGKLRKTARDLAFCVADVCVYQTEEAKSYFPKAAKKHGIIIKNPCNSNLPERYTGERKKTIITACRLHNQKNIPMLLNAFKKLSAEFPDYCLEICGQGEDKDKLVNLTHKLGLDDKVLFSGFVQDIHTKMRDCAMYVCSSDYEGISNSMLEALGMGIPTISTDCPIGGAREMIESGKNGILVPVGDSDAMCNAMRQVINDPTLAEKLATEAYNVRNDYNITKIAKQWIRIMR